MYIRFCFPIIILLAVCVSANAQEIPDLQKQVQLRKEMIMDYLEEATPTEASRQKSISFMVDIYVQSVLKAESESIDPEQLAGVYEKVKQNHIQLLGNYLTEESLQQYLDSLMEDAEEEWKCRVCDYPKKTNRAFCVFCGAEFVEAKKLPAHGEE